MWFTSVPKYAAIWLQPRKPNSTTCDLPPGHHAGHHGVGGGGVGGTGVGIGVGAGVGGGVGVGMQ